MRRRAAPRSSIFCSCDYCRSYRPHIDPGSRIAGAANLCAMVAAFALLIAALWWSLP